MMIQAVSRDPTLNGLARTLGWSFGFGAKFEVVVFDGPDLIVSLVLPKAGRLAAGSLLLSAGPEAGLVANVGVPGRESLAEMSKSAVFLARPVVTFFPNKSLNSFACSPFNTQPSLFPS